MKRTGWVLLLLLAGFSWSLFGQSDCGCGDAASPTCYTTFRASEMIGIDVVVPGEYFSIHNTSVTPLITGWRVETLDGLLVRHETYLESPKGHHVSYIWDLTTDEGTMVSDGFYRLVVSTTSTPEIEAYVKILPCCCSPCWGCCPAPCSCTSLSRCRPCCGEPYIQFFSAGSRSCCGCRLTIFGSVEAGTP